MDAGACSNFFSPNKPSQFCHRIIFTTFYQQAKVFRTSNRFFQTVLHNVMEALLTNTSKPNASVPQHLEGKRANCSTCHKLPVTEEADIYQKLESTT